MATSTSSGSRPTATAILDIAERLVQVRGFNGFSYADVAAELGITKAALHYHFAGKSELGEHLIVRYSERFSERLDDIERRGIPATEKLLAYCDLYRAVLLDHRMCLCGIMAAEYDTLPDPMRRAILSFFDRNQSWLAALLGAAASAGTLRVVGTPDEAARSIVAGLEGAMLVSRPYGDPAVLDAVIDRVMVEFAPPGSREAPPGPGAVVRS
jgi:TetR/AcrR family transcriptional regulator, transcriptional repressor for nem operon